MALITIEGIDGAGKTTLVPHLASQLHLRGIPHITTCSPTGTPLGEDIRRVARMHPEATHEASYMLFQSAFAQLISHVIRPAMQEGKWVICDRYYHSSLAYQNKIKPSFIMQSTLPLVYDCQPDAVIWVDTPPEIAQKRAQKRGLNDHYDSAPLGFYKMIRMAYKILYEEAQDTTQRWYVYKPDSTPQEVIDAICSDLTSTNS